MTETRRPPRMNSRLGQWLPDVMPPDPAPLTKRILDLIHAFGDGRLSLDAYEAAILDAYRADPPWTAYAAEIERVTREERDLVLWRESVGERDWQLQIIHIHDGEVHPPHGHHNVVSTQALLNGRLDVREYERVAVLPGGDVRLRPLVDQPFQPGDAMQSSDRRRNVHWFAATDGPALMLNLNVRGFEADTVEPLGSTLGRRLYDPTLGLAPEPEYAGCLIGALMAPPEAYQKFGDHPLSAFPGRIEVARSQPVSIAPP